MSSKEHLPRAVGDAQWRSGVTYRRRGVGAHLARPSAGRVSSSLASDTASSSFRSRRAGDCCRRSRLCSRGRVLPRRARRCPCGSRRALHHLQAQQPRLALQALHLACVHLGLVLLLRSLHVLPAITQRVVHEPGQLVRCGRYRLGRAQPAFHPAVEGAQRPFIAAQRTRPQLQGARGAVGARPRSARTHPAARLPELRAQA